MLNASKFKTQNFLKNKNNSHLRSKPWRPSKQSLSQMPPSTVQNCSSHKFLEVGGMRTEGRWQKSIKVDKTKFHKLF